MQMSLLFAYSLHIIFLMLYFRNRLVKTRAMSLGNQKHVGFSVSKEYDTRKHNLEHEEALHETVTAYFFIFSVSNEILSEVK